MCLNFYYSNFDDELKESLCPLSEIQDLYVDELYFDYTNILLHNMNANPIPEDDLTDETLRETFREIDFIVKKILPQKLIYISADGPEPAAKLPKKRQRHYAREENVFSSNLIFVSEPVERSMELLKEFIKEKMKNDPVWMQCKVLVSTSCQPGEAEFKILNYIRKSKEETDESLRRVFFTNDNSFLAYILQIHEPTAYIIFSRQRNYSGNPHIKLTLYSDNDLICVSLDRLRNGLFKLGCVDESEKEGFIDDFIGIYSILQNNYLPTFPDITQKFELKQILDIYEKAYTSAGNLVIDGKFSKPAFLTFLTGICNCCCKGERNKWKAKLEEAVQQNTPKPINDLAAEAYHGINWLLRLISTGGCDWEWMYNGIHSPPLVSVLDYATLHDDYSCDDGRVPTFLFSAFLCAQPSKLILPEVLYSVRTEDDRILEMFPKEVSKYKKKFDIPDIDIDYLHAVMEEAEPFFTGRHVRQNRLIGEIEITSESEKVTEFWEPSQFPFESKLPSPFNKRKTPFAPKLTDISIFGTVVKECRMWISLDKMAEKLKIQPRLLENLVRGMWSKKYRENLGLGLLNKDLIVPSLARVQFNPKTKQTTIFLSGVVEFLAKSALATLGECSLEKNEFDDNNAQALRFVDNLYRTTPYLQHRSFRCYPADALRMLERGKYRGPVVRIKITGVCTGDLGSEGIIIGATSMKEGNFTLVMMDEPSSETTTLHGLLSVPRGLVLMLSDFEITDKK